MERSPREIGALTDQNPDSRLRTSIRQISILLETNTSRRTSNICRLLRSQVMGTIRYRTTLNGSQAETCTSNPFGDSLSCAGTDPSNKHFTGQLRDEDTGLDYFGARYYASVQGRFLTPDGSATPEAVPYGHFETPQSMNLYAFVNMRGCPRACRRKRFCSR